MCDGLQPYVRQARLFDKCLKSITFTMVSVEAGNAFLRRLAMKVCCSKYRQSKYSHSKYGIPPPPRDEGIPTMAFLTLALLVLVLAMSLLTMAASR